VSNCGVARSWGKKWWGGCSLWTNGEYPGWKRPGRWTYNPSSGFHCAGGRRSPGFMLSVPFYLLAPGRSGLFHERRNGGYT